MHDALDWELKLSPQFVTMEEILTRSGVAARLTRQQRGRKSVFRVCGDRDLNFPFSDLGFSASAAARGFEKRLLHHRSMFLSDRLAGGGEF